MEGIKHIVTLNHSTYMECTVIKDKYNVMESDQAKGVNTIVVLQLLIIRKVYHQDKYPTA